MNNEVWTCCLCGEIKHKQDEVEEYHEKGLVVCEDCLSSVDDLMTCIECGKLFLVGQDGNELGFCHNCQEDKDFPYDLDAYYEDYDNDKVAFKGTDTKDLGLLEPYRKIK